VEEKNPQTDTKEPSSDITDELNILLDSIIRINRETEYTVYTIMVHNSNSRESAEMAMKLVFQAQIQIRPKLEYVPPSYKVKVGQFFTQLEAFPILEQLRKDFPNAVMVPERIFLR
jgi:hypothetical protein